MLEQQRHINLHLPTGWNNATTEELEHIAAAIIYTQQRQDRYHPFDWAQVKLMALLAINGIEVVSTIDEEVDDTTYMVKRNEDAEPWPITVSQIFSLCERMEWIDDEKTDKTVFLFPYQELTLPRKEWHGGNDVLTLVGPPPMLDGYTWQEYRWLTDWMQEYMRIGNIIANVDSKKKKMDDLLKQHDNARSHFLAVLFKHKEGTQPLDASLFDGFDNLQWQVILFWWSSLMAILARKFPKVFKQQPVGKQRRQQKDTPWDFYNRVIATIQKYVGGLSEQDVNNASYGTILQQLDMMAREAEEMEKLNKKYKK